MNLTSLVPDYSDFGLPAVAATGMITATLMVLDQVDAVAAARVIRYLHQAARRYVQKHACRQTVATGNLKAVKSMGCLSRFITPGAQTQRTRRASSEMHRHRNLVVADLYRRKRPVDMCPSVIDVCTGRSADR